jgi:hypothetical protein
MSIAAAQASAFYEEAARHGSVLRVLEDDSFLVFPVDGKDVVPFWSTRSRVEKVQTGQSKFANYAISEIPLSEFLNATLAQLDEEHINVGVNWSGDRLVGYDMSVSDLRRNLEHRLSRREELG